MKIIIFSLFLTIVMAVHEHHDEEPFCLKRNMKFAGKPINSFYRYQMVEKISALNGLVGGLSAEEQKIFDLVVYDLINYEKISEREKARLRLRLKEKDLVLRVRNLKSERVGALFEFASELVSMVDYGTNLKMLTKTSIDRALEFLKNELGSPGIVITDPLVLINQNISIFKKIYKPSTDNQWRLLYYLTIPASHTCKDHDLKIPSFYENPENEKRAIPQIHDKKLGIVQAENQYQQKNPYKYDIIVPSSSYRQPFYSKKVPHELILLK